MPQASLLQEIVLEQFQLHPIFDQHGLVIRVGHSLEQTVLFQKHLVELLGSCAQLGEQMGQLPVGPRLNKKPRHGLIQTVDRSQRVTQRCGINMKSHDCNDGTAQDDFPQNSDPRIANRNF